MLPRHSTSSTGSHRSGAAPVLTPRVPSQAGSSPSSPTSRAARAAAGPGRRAVGAGGGPQEAPRRRTAPEAPTNATLWQRLEAQWSSGTQKPSGGRLRRAGSGGGRSDGSAGAARGAGTGTGPPTPLSADALGRGRGGTSPVAAGAGSARDWSPTPALSEPREEVESGVGEIGAPAGDAGSGVGSRSTSDILEWLDEGSEASGKSQREKRSAPKKGARDMSASQNVVDVMEKLWQF